ncbi:54S ribosomal protein L4, mitochondrial [Phanerochaete sordida]|uniref:Large ribosomal subunit protein uL29m n=1 Tax=Phanerochaete sordida TaxID=48140 RepID=A0A9P3GNM4_9APHY|nr:54S ribosomal protein L4, mitochondrial [Phanerochaete sordida]
MLPPALSRSLQGLARAACSRPAVFVAPAGSQARTFASVVPGTPATSKASTPSTSKVPTPEGHVRPHLGVEVNPNHGLYAFFRRVEKDGEVDYETVESRDHANTGSSRSWSAPELRRKNFKDLHTLWYVLLRERNLLATQRAEGKRMNILENRLSSPVQATKVRKSMARIKYVINERRVAFEQAITILEERRQAKLSTEEKERETQRVDEELVAQEELKAAQKPAQAPPQEVNLAVDGLFSSASQNAKQS